MASASCLPLQCVTSLLSLETSRCSSCLLSCSSSSCSFSTSHSCRAEPRLPLTACLHWRRSDTTRQRGGFDSSGSGCSVTDLDLLVQLLLQLLHLRLEQRLGAAQLTGPALRLLHLPAQVCVIGWRETNQSGLSARCSTCRAGSAPRRPGSGECGATFVSSAL